MKFLGKDIKAVIFDMDGTMINSTGLWHEIDKKFFAKRGMELPKDYAQNIVHLGLKEAARFTKKHTVLKKVNKRSWMNGIKCPLICINMMWN